MNILALDTSLGACSAAVLRAGGDTRALFARYEEMQRGHAEALMPMVYDVMAEAGIRAGDLDVIAASLGPGSFTGVRIAIAGARGLALVTQTRLFGTDSLTVMARTALMGGARPNEPFAVAVDARRGMLYFGLFDADGRKIEGPLLAIPEDAAALLPDGLRFAVGSGAALLTEAAARHGRDLETALTGLQPNAAALAEIASESKEASILLRPLYLRPPDAKPQAQAVERS